MSQEEQPEHISKKRVVYRMPGMDAVTVRRDIVYQVTDAGALTMDVYSPPDAQSGARLPAVVIVAGFPDGGFQKIVGCRFKEMGSTVSWARLMAASGMAAIAYSNREPVADVRALLEFVRRDAASLGIDGAKIGLWASSGNVPLALSLLREEPPASLACAALLYGYTLDLEGSTGVAEAAKRFGFANPGAGKSVEGLRENVPLFVVRAGQDRTPALNDALDRFVVAALARNLPLTVVSHAAGPHAFDLLDDGATSIEIVRQVLAFLGSHLL